MVCATGFQPVVSCADRRDALSSITGGTPVVRSKSAKLTLTLPDLSGKWFGTFGGSDELIDQAGMGFRVLESELG